MIVTREIIIGIGIAFAIVGALWVHGLHRRELNLRTDGGVIRYMSYADMLFHKLKRMIAVIMGVGGLGLSLAFYGFINLDVQIDPHWLGLNIGLPLAGTLLAGIAINNHVKKLPKHLRQPASATSEGHRLHPVPHPYGQDYQSHPSEHQHRDNGGYPVQPTQRPVGE